MKVLLLIGVGGFAGAISRHLVGTSIDRWQHDHDFPWGILTANLLGCLIIGLLYGVTEHIRALSAETRALVVTGFLGSLTTFSTFSVNTFDLLKKGQLGLGLANIAVSLLLGLGMVWLGYSLVGWTRPHTGAL